jgi:hypothetical protein
MTDLEKRMVAQWAREQDKKLEAHMKGEEVAAQAVTSTTPLPPKSPVEEALQFLARELGSGNWTLPAFATINRTMDDEGEIATGFTVEGFFFPLKLAYDLNIVALDGRVDVYRLGPILHTLKGGSPLTQPARRPQL